MVVELSPIEDLCNKNQIGYVENTKLSFIDVPGQIATVVFVRGCSIRCPDCHNCALQTFDETKETTVDKVVNELNKLELSHWIVFQGGEPLDQADFVKEIIKKLDTKFNVCVYSGYGLEVVKRKHQDILALPNVRMVKAGRYIKSKSVEGKFLATSNQQVILKHKINKEDSEDTETQWVKLDWLHNEKEHLEDQVLLTDY